MFSELAVKITADMKDFEKGMVDIQKKISDMGKKTELLGKSLSKNVTLPIVAAGTGILALGLKTSETADRIDKMSQKLGMSRDSFQKYDFILSQSGASIDSMGSGMKTLTNSISGVLGGVDSATDNFKKLGVEVLDVNGKTRNQNDVFDDVVRSFQKMENGVEKTKMAQDIFGKSGQELLPLLNSTEGSLDNLESTFRSLGLAMTDEAIDAGVQFTDTLDQIKRSLGASVAAIGVEFLPLLQKMGNWIISDGIPLLREFIDNIRILFERFSDLSPETQKIIGIFIAVAAAIGPALVVFGKLIGVFALLVSPIGLIVLAIAGITAAIIYLYQTNEDFANFVLEVWEKIQIAFEFLAEIFKKVITGDIKGAIMEFENMLFGMTMISQDNIYKITEFLLNLKEIFVSLGKMIKSVIQGDIESAFHIFEDNILSMFIKSEDVLYEIGELFYTFQEIFFKVVEGIGEIIEERFIPLLEKIKETFMMIVDAVKPILLDMLAFIGEIFMTIVEFWNENGAQLIDAVLNITNFIVGLFTIFANVIMDIVKFFLPFITGLFEVAWILIKDIFRNTLKVILGIFKLFIGIFTGDWRKAWQGVKDIFTGLLGNIVAVFKGILNSMINQINFFIGKINKLKIKVPSVNIPLVGEVGGFEIGIPNIPTIPFLAEGGIVTAPTLAMIGEDRNPEMVIPLNKIASLTNNKQTNIYLDGKQISNVVAPHMVDTLRTKLAY